MYIVILLMLSQWISYSVIWKVLSCDFLAHNCLFMGDLILILIIIFSTLNFYVFVVICMLNVDNVLYPSHGCFECRINTVQYNIYIYFRVHFVISLHELENKVWPWSQVPSTFWSIDSLRRYNIFDPFRKFYNPELLIIIATIFTGYGNEQGGFFNSPSQFASPSEKQGKVVPTYYSEL
jgi:hypothetical protein